MMLHLVVFKSKIVCSCKIQTCFKKETENEKTWKILKLNVVLHLQSWFGSIRENYSEGGIGVSDGQGHIG